MFTVVYTENAHTLLYAVHDMCEVSTYPVFVQLFDDDIVSLFGLTLISDPKCLLDSITQLTLSLYLMTQCQLKLRHSVTSLARTFHYIQLAQNKTPADKTVDQLTLNLASRRILIYVKMISNY